MLKLLLRTVTACALIYLLPATAHAGNEIAATSLPNGMKVIVREGHQINLVTVDVWVRAGSANEGEANNGISHMTEHMLFKATKRFGPGQFDRELEGVGGELNGGTSRDYIHFYTTVASKYFPVAVDLVGDALTNPEFRQEDLDKERQVVQDEIARAESDPARAALALFYKTIYTTHPYRYAPVGSRTGVAGLSRDDLVAYYNRYFSPANTCVVVTGDVDREAALALVTKAFDGYGRNSGAGPAPEPPAEPKLDAPISRKYVALGDQTHVVLGFLAPPGSMLRESCALDMVRSILGDTNRGRIASDLSAAGVKYTSIDPDYVNQRYTGVFTVTIGVDRADAERAASVVLGELARLRSEPVTSGELEDARGKVIGENLYYEETFAGQARQLGLYESIGSYTLAAKYESTAMEIKADSIQFACARYFDVGKYCLVIVGPEGSSK